MEERSYKVYIHEFPNGKVYIGQTCVSVNNRWRNGRGYCQQPYLDNAINKYGWNNIVHDILEIDLTREEADKSEQEWIAYYDATNPKYGYNIDNGGMGKNRHSEQTKDKIRKANIGRIVSDETRKKLSVANSGQNNAMYGMYGDKNHFYGKHHTEETKKRLSEKAKERNYSGSRNPSARAVVQLDINDNCIGVYPYIKKASKDTNIPIHIISRCCRGVSGYSKKYKCFWMYLDEYKEGGGFTHEAAC